MQRMRTAAVLVAAIAGIGLSGCVAGDPPMSDTPSPASTLPPGVQDVPLADWTPEPNPQDDERMRYPCEAGAETTPFGCVVYVSTGGHDGAQEMPWLVSRPLLVRFGLPLNPDLDNGANLSMGVSTPCNGLNIALLGEGDTLTPTVEGPMMTLMGCAGSASAAESWAIEFISRPMTYTLEGSTLTLTSGDDEVVFAGQPLEAARTNGG